MSQHLLVYQYGVTEFWSAMCRFSAEPDAAEQVRNIQPDPIECSLDSDLRILYESESIIA